MLEQPWIKPLAFAGEVESKLSTLGQVMIDSATGIITDIDFSINPMMIDRGDATTTSSTSALRNRSWCRH